MTTKKKTTNKNELIYYTVEVNGVVYANYAGSAKTYQEAETKGVVLAKKFLDFHKNPDHNIFVRINNKSGIIAHIPVDNPYTKKKHYFYWVHIKGGAWGTFHADGGCADTHNEAVEKGKLFAEKELYLKGRPSDITVTLYVSHTHHTKHTVENHEELLRSSVSIVIKPETKEENANKEKAADIIKKRIEHYKNTIQLLNEILSEIEKV